MHYVLCRMTKGCVRGVLSPTLFIIFMNDILNGIPSFIHCGLYANDLVMLCSHEQLYITSNTMQERDPYRRCISRWRALIQTLHYLHERRSKWDSCMYPWCLVRRWPSNVVLIRNNCPRYVEVLSLSMICQCTLRIALSPLLKGYRLCTWRALTHDDGNLQKRKSAIKGRYLQTHQPHNICGERNGRPNQRKTQVVVAWKQEKKQVVNQQHQSRKRRCTSRLCAS